MIERLSRAVSLRDEETGRHIERMSRYAAVLADAVGFTGLPLDDLRLATALHDVGKIGVPDGILLKPGALSPRRVRGDATPRADRLPAARRLDDRELLRIAADIALDAPRVVGRLRLSPGLQGEEIPEEAQDRGGRRRVRRAHERPRVPPGAVVRRGHRHHGATLRGRQFEPRLLDAFFGAIDEIASIREAYPDQDEAQARIRVLVVDDHEIFAQSLVRLLENRPELKVVGTAGTVADGGRRRVGLRARRRPHGLRAPRR